MQRGVRRRWRRREPEPATEAAAQALADQLGLPRLVGLLLAQRGLADRHAAERFLRPSLQHLHDPALLPGCTRAAQRIVHALRHGQRICLYGDYDVDGVTGIAILYHILRAADPNADVQRYIPHRIDEGYGLNGEALANIIDHGAELIVSVDCGVTAVEPARVARDRGVDLIITDHHEFGAQLPDVHTMVHPRLDDGAYPFGDLCGAGVACKLAWQIAREFCGSERVSETFRALLVDLLSLAALGTVADVVPLVGENRTLVRFGLGQIKRTRFEGLNALIDASRLRDEKIDAYHVGFVLGPRLNACGRMGHAIEACRLLTDATGEQARALAAQLNSANDQRRNTERAIFQQASELIAARGDDADDRRAIVLGDASWHPGVVGIVCSRLVEKFGRPVVLLNTADGRAQGSARSIDALNIHEAFTACAEHLDTYGGHAMAAGCTLPAASVEVFREALVDYVNARLTADDLATALEVDAAVALEQLTVDLIEAMDRLAPFGRGNEQPLVLIPGVRLAQPPRPVGRDAAHLQLVFESGGATVRGIAWRMGPYAERIAEGQTLDIVARPQINEWNGRRRPEVEVVDLAIQRAP